MTTSTQINIHCTQPRMTTHSDSWLQQQTTTSTQTPAVNNVTWSSMAFTSTRGS